jgi:phospholipid-translocating ATPase
MVASEIVTLFFYVISIAFLPEYFGTSILEQRNARELPLNSLFVDLSFVISVPYAWKVALIVAVSSLPLYIINTVRSRLNPATFTKLS